MRTRHGSCWIGLCGIALVLGLAALPAAAQEPPKLRYGFQNGEQYGYEVKLVADLPDAESTYEGVITYAVLSANDDQFVVKTQGGLANHVKSKETQIGPRHIGPPSFHPPMHGFGPFAEPSRPEGTTIGRKGNVIIAGVAKPLPLLLGYQEMLVIEPLSDEPKSAWSKQTDLGVVERSSSRRIGPPRTSETNRGATEQIDYSIQEIKDGWARVSKTYSLKTAPEAGGTSYIEMSGKGEFAFNIARGIIHSETMKYDIRVSQNNVNVSIPMTLTIRMLSQAEMAERKKQAEAAAAAAAEAARPKAIDAETRAQLLQDLRSTDERRVQAAARQLAKGIVDDKAAEVSRALVRALRGGNDWTQAAVLEALKVWATPDAESGIIAMTKSTSWMVRGPAVSLLGKFKTEAAAKAAADAFVQNRGEAAAAMKAIGPLAEPYLIPLFSDRDFWVRNEACGVATEIGGKKSLRALKQESAKLSWHENRAFEPAIAAIERRVAQGGGGDDAEPAAEEPKPAAEGKSRTWHDSTGTYTIEATFLSVADGKVSLKKADGRKITLAVDKLSEDDQAYVEQLSKAKKPVNPFE